MSLIVLASRLLVVSVMGLLHIFKQTSYEQLSRPCLNDLQDYPKIVILSHIYNKSENKLK